MKRTSLPAPSRSSQVPPAVAEGDWFAFPGGELEGLRPRVLCEACRERLARAANGSDAGPAVLCFQCYRAGLERDRRLKAAGELDTASEARFQAALPYEPVNQERLARLRTERVAAKTEARAGAGLYVDRRRQAQIAARHAIQRIVAGVRARDLAKREADRAFVGAMHAAELQLPEAWLPFVSAR